MARYERTHQAISEVNVGTHRKTITINGRKIMPLYNKKQENLDCY